MGEAENIIQREGMIYINGGQVKRDLPPVKSATLYRIPNKGIRGRRSTLPDGYPDTQGGLTIKNISVNLYIEFKASGKKCTDQDQLDFIRDRKSEGAIALWCNSLHMLRAKLGEQVRTLNVALETRL